MTPADIATLLRTKAERSTETARAMQAAHGFTPAEASYSRAAAYAEAADLIEKNLLPPATRTTRKTTPKE